MHWSKVRGGLSEKDGGHVGAGSLGNVDRQVQSVGTLARMDVFEVMAACPSETS